MRHAFCICSILRVCVHNGAGAAGAVPVRPEYTFVFCFEANGEKLVFASTLPVSASTIKF